jgi:hypothetical protein
MELADSVLILESGVHPRMVITGAVAYAVLYRKP